MATTPAQDRAFFGHPRGLSTLFFTEMWERFSYYGMRALLLLYMTAPLSAGGLGFDAAQGGAVYGLYTSMVYMATLPGGWIADRLIGPRRAVLYGGLLIAAGHFSMASSALAMFYLGLFLIVIGTGPAEGQRQRRSSASCIRRKTLAVMQAFRSSTWASTSARSSRRWCAATLGSKSTGISDSPPPASA